jgi:transcriptional regulator NrdR family protein
MGGLHVADKVFNGGQGILCPKCGASLNRVSHTRTGPGFIHRERHCPNPECRYVHRTSERIIRTEEKRTFSDPC